MGKLLLTTTTAVAVAFLTASLAPAQPAAQERIVEPPVHEQSVTGTLFNLTPSVDFEHAAITVAGPNGYAFSDLVPGNGHVSVDLAHEPLPLEGQRKGDVGVEGLDNPGTLPDGKYNYEVVLYHADGTTTRVSGTFRVEGGSALESRVYPGIPGSQQLTGAGGPGLASRLIGAVLDFVIPSARSVQLVDDEIEIFDAEEDQFTFLNLRNHNGNTWGLRNDNNLLRFAVTNGGTPMAITSSGNVGIGTTAPAAKLMVIGDTGATALRARVGNSSKLRVNSNGGVAVGANFGGDDTPDNGLRVSGDTQLDGGLTVLTGTELNGGLTVSGDTGVLGDLMLTGTTPEIRFDNTSGDNINWKIGEVNDDLGIRQLTGTGTGVHMSIEEGGNVGMGTSSPDKQLHVEGSDSLGGANNNVQLKVSNNSGTSTRRDMLTLENFGEPKFVLSNTDNGETWDFSARTDGFNINLLGTGGPELRVAQTGFFQISSFGNSTFTIGSTGKVFMTNDVLVEGTVVHSSSRDVKKAVTPVDHQVVLDKLGQLEVAEWSYKKDADGDRHLSPMAEDFHAAFGLGPDNRHVAPSDLAGVALAAAKALKVQTSRLESENRAKDKRIAELEARMVRLESMISE